MTDNITEQEAEELIRAFGESKSNIHNFLTNIVKTKDTTRVANITADELGEPVLPVRTYMELALFSKEVGMEAFASYFEGMREVVTAPTLSKDGFLIRQATIQRKEFSDTTKKTKQAKKGFFRRGKEENES